MAPVSMLDAAGQLAVQAGQAMFAQDAASQALGMALVSIGPGHACLTMTVRADMINGHGNCHGGFIFSLADSSFAFACNSYNDVAVGTACSIDYVSPARVGEVLVAQACEQALQGKSGIYDVSVCTQEGRLVALFRGKSLRVGGTHIAPASVPTILERT